MLRWKGTMLFGALSLSIAACSDIPFTPPQSGRLGPRLNTDKLPKLEMKEGNVYGVTINSEIELYDKQGNEQKKFTHSSRVSARVVDGMLIALNRRGSLRNASLSATMLQEEVPDSIDMMPVLGVSSGELDGSYDDTVDNDGDTTRIVGSTSTSGIPVNTVYTYLNDTLTNKVSMVWQSVSGGFAMTSQIQKNYYSTGTIAAIVWSTPDMSTYTVQEQRSVAYRAAKSVENVINRALCAIGPSVAYAAPTSGVSRPIILWLYLADYRFRP